LRVVAEELADGNHCEAAVLELLRLEHLEGVLPHRLLSRVKIAKEAVVVLFQQVRGDNLDYWLIMYSAGYFFCSIVASF